MANTFLAAQGHTSWARAWSRPSSWRTRRDHGRGTTAPHAARPADRRRGRRAGPHRRRSTRSSRSTRCPRTGRWWTSVRRRSRVPPGRSSAAKTIFWNGPMGVFEIAAVRARARMPWPRPRRRTAGGRGHRGRRRGLGRRGPAAGARREDDPCLHRRRGLPRVPRGAETLPGVGRPAGSDVEHRAVTDRAIRRVDAPRDPRLAGQPDGRGGGRARRRDGGDGGRSQRAPSTGAHEAVELRDGDRPATAARGCCEAVANVNDDDRGRGGRSRRAPTRPPWTSC